MKQILQNRFSPTTEISGALTEPAHMRMSRAAVVVARLALPAQASAEVTIERIDHHARLVLGPPGASVVVTMEA